MVQNLKLCLVCFKFKLILFQLNASMNHTVAIRITAKTTSASQPLARQNAVLTRFARWPITAECANVIKDLEETLTLAPVVVRFIFLSKLVRMDP